jgi:hypothetical protein
VSKSIADLIEERLRFDPNDARAKEEREAWDLYAAALLPLIAAFKWSGRPESFEGYRENCMMQAAVMLEERRKRWG